MGYEIHITRRKGWLEEGCHSEDTEISLSEWRCYASGDDDLRPVPENGEGFFELIDADGWFDHFEGSLRTKNPNDAVFVKAHLLSAALRAKVQGEEGETYLPNGEFLEPVEDAKVVVRYPGWLLLLCLFAIGCFVVTMLNVLGF